MAAWRSRCMHWILKVFYRLLYHRMAWTYDAVAWFVSVGLWTEWVRSVLPYLEGARVLELGHGPGHLQMELQKRSGPGLTVGLDRSLQMGKVARLRLRRKKIEPKLIQGESQSLPFSDQSFDQVVATFPTEYITDPNTLAEIWRVLAPHGSLIVLPAAYITGRRLRERLAAALFRATGQAPEWKDAALHPAWRAGFETRLEYLDLESSRLIVIVARKVAR